MISGSRRKVLGLFGAAPFAAKAAAEQLAGITTMGASSAPQSGMVSSLLSDGPQSINSAGSNLSREKKRVLLKAALSNPALRAELEALAYEEQRTVTFIDHDLASKRSFSLAAKITFQRQRNVERSMQQTCQDSPWMRIDDWAKNIFAKIAGF